MVVATNKTDRTTTDINKRGFTQMKIDTCLVERNDTESKKITYRKNQQLYTRYLR